MESLEELFCNEINILTIKIIIFQYYKYKYNKKRYVNFFLKNLDFDTKIYKNIEFIIKIFDKMFIVFVIVIVYFDKNNEFFVITVDLFCTEFLYNLIKRK